MTSYKVQLLHGDEDYFWQDFYLNVEEIQGFYVYLDEEIIEGEPVKPILVYVAGENFTLKPEPHIEKYLLERFCNKFISVKNG